jgi:hypothetical protein
VSQIFNVNDIVASEARMLGCPAGKRVFGGGVRLLTLVPEVGIAKTAPSLDGTAWEVELFDLVPTNGPVAVNFDIEIRVVCASAP